MIIVLAAALVLLAGLFSAADAALTSFSRARAEELQAEGQAGARRLVTMLADPAPYLNTAILLRLLCEVVGDRDRDPRDLQGVRRPLAARARSPRSA